MSIATEKIEKIFNCSFQIDNFVELVKEIFSTAEIIAPERYITETSKFSSHIVNYSNVGKYKTPDDKNVAIFAVRLKNEQQIENARSLQRNFAQKLLQNGNLDAALIAFFDDANEIDKTWRLSLVCHDYEIKNEDGRIKINENVTPAKRYSYLVGETEPCHTAIERFHKFVIDNNSNPTLDELKETFSVETVTKEFFDKYCEKFYELVEYLIKNKDFQLESERCGFTTEQFAKKLMGQIVFLYFLQKKGWLGVGVWQKEISEKDYNNIFYIKGVNGKEVKKYLPLLYEKSGDKYLLHPGVLDKIPDDIETDMAMAAPNKKKWGTGSKKFLRTLFEHYKNSKAKKNNFYDDILEPLFYNSLNVNRGEFSYSAQLHCRIPFLSGGLFEPLDGYNWKKSNFNIPDTLFSNKKNETDLEAEGILDIFDRYNFTMCEDEPMEHEVAIDPEMLGKVFENLLEVKDRKSKGAFYTPREIVNYMCEESLINYLSTNSTIPEESIRNFVLYSDSYKDDDAGKLTGQKDKNGNVTYKIKIGNELSIPKDIFDPNNDINRLIEIDKLLENVRVADPAVGSGAFPLGMLNLIVRCRQNITPYLVVPLNDYDRMITYVSERSTYNLKYDTIKNCIFAVDIMPSAVDIARLRLWLSLVIEDQLNDIQYIGHNNPLPLHNLECNIICGNSLVDEFHGCKLIPQSEMLHTKKVGESYSMFQSQYESLIPRLIDAQNELFNCSDTLKKEGIIEKINGIKDEIICAPLTDNIKEKYEEECKEQSKPFILWQIEFAKVFAEKGGFDIVIGNPPYIDFEEMTNSMPEQRQLYQDIYDCAAGNWDIYICFFEKGIKCLNEKGNLIYITPDKWISKSFGDALRKKYINNLKQILVAGREVFDSAIVDSIITMFSNLQSNNINVFQMDSIDKSIKQLRTVEKSILKEPYTLDILFSNSIQIIDKLNKFKKLGDIYQCENACATSACYDLKTILYSVDKEDEYLPKKMYKVINTGTIDRYISKWGKTEMKYLKDKYQFPVVEIKKFHELFPNTYGDKPKKKKVIIKGLTLLDNCIDFKGEIVPGKSTMIVSAKTDDELKIISAIINSKISIFYIKQKYSSSSYNGGINFSKDMIDDLPYPPIKDVNDIVNKVDLILKYRKENELEKALNIENEINAIIYESLNLDSDEIKVIEE